MKPKIVLVAAMGLHREIGRRNTIPWRIPTEMQHFKRATLDTTVVMGRLTAESIGMKLPRRKNLVLTSHKQAPYPGQTPVRSMEEAIALTTTQELMVIGGSKVYELFAPVADRMILTNVDVVVAGADAFFPEISMDDFYVNKSVRCDNIGEISYQITYYSRR